MVILLRLIMKMSLLSMLAFSCCCQLSAMGREPDTPWEFEPETPLEKLLAPIEEIPDDFDLLDTELATAFDNNKRTSEDLYDSDEETALDSRLKKKYRSGFCATCNTNYVDFYHHRHIIHGDGSKVVACIHPGCNKQVPAYSMKDHLYNIHGNGSKLVACTHPDCNKQVPGYTMRHHLYNIHGDGSKLVACTHPGCNKQIATYYMKQHMDIIHGDSSKLVPCSHPGCNFQFKKQALIRHLKTHVMNTQDYFTCNYQSCNNEFTSITSIVNHLKKEHELSSPWKRYYNKVTRMLNS